MGQTTQDRQLAIIEEARILAAKTERWCEDDGEAYDALYRQGWREKAREWRTFNRDGYGRARRELWILLGAPSDAE